MGAPGKAMHKTDEWFTPTDPPDFWRYFGSLPDRVPSWALQDTIWTPHWKDAFPPAPLLCSAWGGYTDESRMNKWASI